MYRAKYYPGIFSAYERNGKGWIRALPQDEIKAFAHLGFTHADYGRAGGRAIVNKRGREYMQRIGRIGAIAANSKKLWTRLMLDEMEKLGLL